MPILENKKLIFIHIPKCAGTSIVNSLNMDTSGHYSAGKVVAQQPIHPKIHDPEYISFTLVRNPWDRLVSCYELARMDIRPYYEHEHEDYALMKNIKFSDVIQLLANPMYNHIFRHPGWRPQEHWVYDDDNKCNVDYIFKMENMHKELPEFFKKFELHVDIKHLNKSSRSNYTDYYTPELVEIVGEIYKSDIQKFEYKYGE
jgi:hypothetical protein